MDNLDYYLRSFCCSVLPFLFAFVSYLSASNSKTLRSPNNLVINSLLVLVIFFIAFTPATYYDGSDKGRYMHFFDNIYSINSGSKDVGWYYFVKALNTLTFGSSTLFFLIVAIIYASSFYVFGKKIFERNNLGYFLLMTFGSLGFVGYGNNVIRNGIALSFCLFALSINRKWISLLLVAIAYTIHGSILIPLSAYVYTVFIKSNRLAFAIWFVCLGLSILNFDFGSVIASLNLEDERISDYVVNGTSSDVMAVYAKAGMFRWDFLIYSIVPLVIALIWIRKYNFKDEFYVKMLNIYILCNALWVLIIRRAYSERFAFYSWLLIPVITLYPLLKGDIQLPNVQKKVYQIICIFLFVNACLTIISW